MLTKMTQKEVLKKFSKNSENLLKILLKFKNFPFLKILTKISAKFPWAIMKKYPENFLEILKRFHIMKDDLKVCFPFL